MEEKTIVKKARCHNCKHAGPQFKVAKLTHCHCQHPKYKPEDFDSGKLCPWDTLRVFNNTCVDHEFKSECVTNNLNN